MHNISGIKLGKTKLHKKCSQTLCYMHNWGFHMKQKMFLKVNLSIFLHLNKTDFYRLNFVYEHKIRTMVLSIMVSTDCFRLIWFINQRSLYSHALSVVHRHWCHRWHPHLCTPPPWHRVRPRNFICGMHMQICPPIYAHQIFSDSEL